MERSVLVGGTDFVALGRLSAGSSVELDGNGECAPGIFIEKANGRYEPVNALLWGLKDAVMRAITSIESAVPK